MHKILCVFAIFLVASFEYAQGNRHNILRLMRPRQSNAGPVPTPDQLAWSRHEIGVLIHFGMGTYLDGDGCDDPSHLPNITLFNPTDLNTDQWMEAIRFLNATYAVLVAKHNCGFTLFPTKATVPSTGQKYTYDVKHSKLGVDVVQTFINSCQKAGIRTGFYYSVVTNYYCHVSEGKVLPPPIAPGMINVTQDDYNAIVLFQLQELWSRYGQLDEIWFDGGYTTDLQANITKLLVTLQPHASIFNGFGLTKNPVRWMGNEMGKAPDPNWSTGTTNDGGDPKSPYWCPAECDTTLQAFDRWFYKDGVPVRPLDELIEVYHNTVGHNCQLMMDLAPTPQGLIAPKHMARYKQLGDFIRTCYGSPAGGKYVSGSASNFTIVFDIPEAVDRVVIQEDQTFGQRIRAYVIRGLPVDAPNFIQLSNGTSVGNKKIDIFASYLLLELQIIITDPPFPSAAILRYFAGYVCDTLPGMVQVSAAHL